MVSRLLLRRPGPAGEAFGMLGEDPVQGRLAVFVDVVVGAEVHRRGRVPADPGVVDVVVLDEESLAECLRFGQRAEVVREVGDVLQRRQILADAGYCSAANLDYATSLKASSDGRTEFFIATGRVKHGEHVPEVPRGRIPANVTLRERMARKLKTKKGRAVYARRKGP